MKVLDLKLLTIVLFLLFIYCSCDSKSKASSAVSAEKVETHDEPLTESPETTEAAYVPLPIQALLASYPDKIKGFDGNNVILASGETLIYDDGKPKNFQERLDGSDIEDMFLDVYSLPDPEPAYQFDPGRSRAEDLYKSMYGKNAGEVQKNLVPVEWFGQRVQFTSVNGAADSLRAVAKEISLYPELKPYLKSSGTFYWRQVRGAKRMSAHSYGIAFDIAVDKSDYWQWKSGSNDETIRVKYSNRIPRKIVEIFQRHGFIWGGAWYHFDTMHFEFRPELLKYADLMKSSNK